MLHGTLKTDYQKKNLPLERGKAKKKIKVFLSRQFCVSLNERFGSSSDPNLNGHLHYPNDIDRSLNEAATDKIRKYRADYNNNPPNAISFMSAIPSTSGRLRSEFVRLLFLQGHRETDRFFATSGVQLAQHYRDQFHYHRTVFSSQFKSRVDNILVKVAGLRITWNIDGTSLKPPFY